MSFEQIPEEEYILLYPCEHPWYLCDCLECKCEPQDRQAHGGHCERCGGDL